MPSKRNKPKTPLLTTRTTPPDYAEVSAARYWTLYEASCYAVDVDPPEQATPRDWFANIADAEKRERASKIYRYAKDEILDGTLKCAPPLPKGVIAGPQSRVKPAEFLALVNKRFPIPKGLSLVTAPVSAEQLDPRERTTYNNIVGALLTLLMRKDSSTQRGGWVFLDTNSVLRRCMNCSIVTAAMPIPRSSTHETVTQEPLV